THDQGEPEHPKTTIPGAIFTFVCTTVGAGVLVRCSRFLCASRLSMQALPRGLGLVGWCGLILVVLIAVIANHTGKLLIKCLHAVPGKRLRSYEEIGFEAMGERGRKIVSVFQLSTLF